MPDITKCSLHCDHTRNSSCFSSDSDSAPLLERCEGHLTSGPVSGELLLSGGGTPQQARGGGQVCTPALLPPVTAASKLFADHLQLSYKFRLVQTSIRGGYTSVGKAVKLASRGLAAACFAGVSPIPPEEFLNKSPSFLGYFYLSLGIRFSGTIMLLNIWNSLNLSRPGFDYTGWILLWLQEQ